MYKCTICDSIQSGILKRHILYKKDGNIHQEVKICNQCQLDISETSYYDTVVKHRKTIRPSIVSMVFKPANKTILIK